MHPTLRVSERHPGTLLSNEKTKLNFTVKSDDDIPIRRKRGFAFSYGNGGLKYNDPEVMALHCGKLWKRKTIINRSASTRREILEPQVHNELKLKLSQQSNKLH